jgi:hypothetical protein
VIVVGLLVAFEDLGLPDLSRRYDLSWVLIFVLGLFTSVTGLAMAIAAIRRGEAALASAKHTLMGSDRQSILSKAYGIRRRNAWIIVVGAALAIVGVSVIWLAIARIESDEEPSACPGTRTPALRASVSGGLPWAPEWLAVAGDRYIQLAMYAARRQGLRFQAVRLAGVQPHDVKPIGHRQSPTVTAIPRQGM